tara:strand:+ start:628 stop:1794 length:1167 start_codon:yes stop_codon:yes gene_type:complete
VTEIVSVLLILGVAGLVVFGLIIKRKNMDLWFWSYLKQKMSPGRSAHEGPTHVIFCFVDHFEPQWLRPSYEEECERVRRWHEEYPKLAEKHVDADGVHPQHTFFYPEEEYREEHLSLVADICRRGYGEIEVHLHHDNDTAENFSATLEKFVDTLHEKHGAFQRHPETGKLAWAFVHGNWALCNSLADGRFCGIDAELPILRDLGCYCDMTLPCAPSTAQTSTINSIYYAEDVPGRPKSHDTGVEVRVGGQPSGDLMVVQGPLGLNWRRRKKGIIPSIENGDIKNDYRPSPDRVDLWVDTGVHVSGRPEWVFVKVHTHGAQGGDMDANLGAPCDEMYSYLESRYNDGENYCLHYASAREVYNIIKAAEAGKAGDPNDYRDFLIPKPNYR